MITKENELFTLHTKNTTYCFRVMPSGHLEHLYYGGRIRLEGDYQPLAEKSGPIMGTGISYSKEYPQLGLEDVCLEMSSYGKGDIREPFIEISQADGTSTCDFLYRSARLLDRKEPLKTLPSAYLEKAGNTPLEQGGLDTDQGSVSLEIDLFDKVHNITLILTYSVFYDSNIITRSARVINTSQESIRLERIMSSQLDFDTSDYIISTFHGAWAREMKRYDTAAQTGILVNDSKAGTSGNRSNPFFMVSSKTASEDYGDCYGFNLIYSGNHYAACEDSCRGKLRIINGIQPSDFEFLIPPGESFETPEAVLTYSNRGFTGMSSNMHRFIRNHIIRGEWKDRVRPVLINSWEASYFKFNEGTLLRLARAAKDCGMELFVLDDGWFGKRNDDTTSLGDWKDNRDKLSGGLNGLAKKINAYGMDFGIWVEPEMVNEDSDCYRLHPDWAVQIPGTENSLGRNQLILDLTREEVCTYILEEMSRVFSSANISYVKWDMNRIFSDRYSVYLGKDRQKEFGHRYIMGLYQILGVLTQRFPKILFESCASGGNRFDLGMLCYMPQIWASDNTDAICRAAIQSGYSYGYPMSVIGAHVSDCPNHQTLRSTSMDTRFEVAAFGLLGYELNLAELSAEERKQVREQVLFYKKHRETLQFGDFYRIEGGDNNYQWMTVSQDKKSAIGLYLQKEITPNMPYGKFCTKGLGGDMKYHFTNRQHIYNVKDFGNLINMISPIHIKRNSLLHNVIASIKRMPGEAEDCTALGEVFNQAGVKLKPGFGGTGYDENVRLLKDFDSRLYLWEEVDDNNQQG